MRKSLLLVLLPFFILGCGKKAGDMVIQLPVTEMGSSAVLLAANNGPETNEESLFYKYGKFKIRLVRGVNTAEYLSGYTNLDYPIISITMDMVPFFHEAAGKNNKMLPKILSVSDFSSGADGIVVRGNIKNIRDFKGKRIILTRNSSSHFLMLYLLKQGGLSQSDVKMVFVHDTAEAEGSFATNKTIDACVASAPFIYYTTNQKLPSYIKGVSLFTTTMEGNSGYGLIANVFLAREDFIKKNPRVIDAFVKALVEGYNYISGDTNNQAKTAAMIAGFYGLKGGPQEAMAVFKNSHFTGGKECRDFLDNSSSFSANNLFILSSELYKYNGEALPPDYNADPDMMIYSNALINALK